MANTNMWDSVFNWVSDGKNLANLASLATPVISGISAYNQNKLLNKQNDLALQTYNYNKSLNDREIAKENLSQQNLNDGWSNVFGTGSTKKNLTDYYGTSNYSA